jgi:methylthioxylose transferase
MTALRSRMVAAGVWMAAALTIAVSVRWGRSFQREAPEIFLGAAPLVGRDFRDGWDWRFGWGLVGAAVVAAVVIATVVHGWWWRARLRWVVVASALAAGAFATMLALTDGTDGILYGAVHPTEYLANLSITPPAGDFLRTFVERIDGYSVHVRGHPPGFVLVLMAMDAVGLGGGWPAASLSIAGTVLMPAGVLVTVWATAGADWVRRAAPMLVVAPYALWMVTSADAVFTAVGAWGMAAGAVALRSSGARAAVLGAVSGLLLAGLLYLTYGGATFLLTPLTLVAITAVRRRVPMRTVVVVAAAANGAAVLTVVAFWLGGFWWFEGAAETKVQYWRGTAQFRTWTYFAVANIAVALIALGPATLAGAIRLRDRWVWVLVLGGLAALLAAHVSQYSKAEVERIWLLFYPWIAVAAGALVVRGAERRAAAWLMVQATCAILLQAALVSKW